MNMIKELRERRDLSQSDLAELAGTSQPQIKRLESGERKLTKEWAERIAPHLNVTAGILMFGWPEDNDKSPASWPTPEPGDPFYIPPPIEKRPELAIRLADLFAKVMRLPTDKQAQIADLVESQIGSRQVKSRDTTTKQVS